MLFAITDELILGLVTVGFGFLSTVFTGIMAYFSMMLKSKMTELVFHTNSIKDELVEEVRKAALLQGREDERQEQAVEKEDNNEIN